MPNTLVHMGVGRLATKTLFRGVDDKWIYIGCIIPDIPWIIQRAVTFILPGIDLVDLRLYAVIQASLFFGLILSAAFTLLARSGARLFLLLGFNCLLHLTLDAVQIKWANGVHLLAPFSWRMVNFGFFWPESIPVYGLTAIGLALVLSGWQSTCRQPLQFGSPTTFRWVAAAGLLVIYLALPLLLFQGPENADNHYTATLRAHSDRKGRPIAVDRCEFDPDTQTIRLFSGERIRVTGLEWPTPVTVSIKGRFVAMDRIKINSFHIHHLMRDFSSFLGLALVTILWFTAGWKSRRLPTQGRNA